MRKFQSCASLVLCERNPIKGNDVDITIISWGSHVIVWYLSLWRHWKRRWCILLMMADLGQVCLRRVFSSIQLYCNPAMMRRTDVRIFSIDTHWAQMMVTVCEFHGWLYLLARTNAPGLRSVRDSTWGNTVSDELFGTLFINLIMLGK